MVLMFCLKTKLKDFKNLLVPSFKLNSKMYFYIYYGNINVCWSIIFNKKYGILSVHI